MKIIDTMRDGENMGWCVPYATKDESVWVVSSENCVSIKDGDTAIDNATPEQIREYAKKINEDYDLYSGWDDLHILLDGMRSHGCTECPFRDVCEAVQDDVEA